jgi:hypothetical protein
LEDEQFKILVAKIDKLTKILALNLIQNSKGPNKEKIMHCGLWG